MDSEKRTAPYPLRMPDEMREHLQQRANSNKRSLNAEILSRLDSSIHEDTRLDELIDNNRNYDDFLSIRESHSRNDAPSQGRDKTQIWLEKTMHKVINEIKYIKIDLSKQSNNEALLMRDITKKWLNEIEHDSPEARAEFVRDLIRVVYDFVKFERSEGGGLDGRDGPERQGLADVLDAAENHYFNMLERKRD